MNPDHEQNTEAASVDGGNFNPSSDAGVLDRARQAYVGEDYPDYRRIFQLQDQGKGGTGWNWWVFIFPRGWFLRHRLFSWYVLAEAANLYLLFIGARTTPFKIPLFLLCHVAAACIGKALYCRLASRTIGESEEMYRDSRTEAEALAHLRVRGRRLSLFWCILPYILVGGVALVQVGWQNRPPSANFPRTGEEAPLQKTAGAEAEAQFEQAKSYLVKKDPDAARPLLEKAAAQGHKQARSLLENLYDVKGGE